MKALVLAAGKSTRITSVSRGHPKPLIRIAGETILGRNLMWLAGEGVRNIWINVHYRPEEIQEAIGDGSRFGVSVRYVHEPELLGTAGAVRNLASEWKETFLVVYGDSLVRLDLRAMFRVHRERHPLATVALFDRRKHPHTAIAGGIVEADQGGRILAISEGTSDSARPLVNAGVYLLEPEVTADIPQGQVYDFGRDLFPNLLTGGRFLYGHMLDGYCLGVDTPESYREALRLIQTGEVVLA
jgi:NDP-sugar pyrophosphorylase family protein